MLRNKLESEFRELSPLAMKTSVTIRQNLLERAGLADQMVDIEQRMKAYEGITLEANKVLGLDTSWKMY